MFFSDIFSLRRMCPIFQISNVTGENMDLLKMFLNLLSSRTTFSNDEPAEFQIDDTYSVPVWNKKVHSQLLLFFFSFSRQSLFSLQGPHFSFQHMKGDANRGRTNRRVDSGPNVKVKPGGQTTAEWESLQLQVTIDAKANVSLSSSVSCEKCLWLKHWTESMHSLSNT